MWRDCGYHRLGIGMSALITIENLTVRYGRQVALQDVSGTFHAGSLTAIAGPNGAGKSTLLKTIVGILSPKAGRVVFHASAPNIAYLPQTATVQRDFPLSVRQAVATGFWPLLGNGGAITPAMRQKVGAALDEVGLGGLADRQLASLSGGQFQRMLFARVMVQDAPIILLDEPFAAVDAETTARLMQLMLGWHQQGRTVICVLHDLLLIQKYFPDSFVLAGKCLGHGHTHQLLEQKLLSFDLDMAELCAGPEAPSHHQHDHSTTGCDPNHHDHHHDHQH